MRRRVRRPAGARQLRSPQKVVSVDRHLSVDRLWKARQRPLKQTPRDARGSFGAQQPSGLAGALGGAR
jgi:hypothetical protein